MLTPDGYAAGKKKGFKLSLCGLCIRFWRGGYEVIKDGFGYTKIYPTKYRIFSDPDMQLFWDNATKQEKILLALFFFFVIPFAFFLGTCFFGKIVEIVLHG